VRRAKRKTEQGARSESEQHALQTDQRVADQVAALRKLDEGVEHALGRRQDLRRDPAALATDTP
jgi:hypothetical protein